ncbi:MAG: biotin--[acetyl-CoA-carboxylase] ligase [Treponema sp.]|nr:biotin--[acetyl-CoA-carboxylase] ligase [Treponema sp.]
MKKRQIFDINISMTTKEKVLKMLAEAKGQAVSGEVLAAECGVSRAAVWKAVKALREAGSSIEGTTNGGYLLADNDIFSTELFSEAFSTRWPELSDCHIECFKEIDSTNTYAKRLLAECGNLRDSSGQLTPAGQKYHKAIIIAEKQTAGRGRLGRAFVSPEKTGIYISVIYAPKGGITNPARLTASAAVAICRAIKNVLAHLPEAADIEPQIKWINDIFVGGKKVCGVLAEGVANFESGMIEAAVVGMGINIKKNKSAFEGELADVVGTLEDALSQTSPDAPVPSISRVQLAAEIAGQVLKIFEEDSSSPATHIAIIKEYKEASFLLGQELTVYPLIGDEKSSYKARATDIDDNAGLIVTLKDGTKKTLSSGEVSLKSKAFI